MKARWLSVLIVAVGLVSPTPATHAAGQVSSRSAASRAAEVSANLREILASPEFRPEQARNRPIENATRWIGSKVKQALEWLSKLFRAGGAAGAGGSPIFWVLLVALIGGLAWVIAYLIRRGDFHIVRPENKGLSSEADDLDSLDPEAWAARARQLGAAGEFRLAYRAAFIFLLLTLDRAGVVRFDKARTNGEYLRILRSRPAILHLFRPIASEFDARWYGGHSVEESDFARCLDAASRIPATES